MFVDTETGGLNPDSASLLSIGLVLWENGDIMDSKEIFIKHNIFKLTPQAITANKIDMVNFIEQAMPPQEAIGELLDFINKNFSDCLGKIVIGGHNTNFDINFLKKFMNSHKFKFDSLFTHRFIDTASILKFLYYAGKLKEDISSSDAAFQYFGIDVEKRHTALGDAIATAKLFSELVRTVNAEADFKE